MEHIVLIDVNFELNRISTKGQITIRKIVSDIPEVINIDTEN